MFSGSRKTHDFFRIEMLGYGYMSYQSRVFLLSATTFSLLLGLLSHVPLVHYLDAFPRRALPDPTATSEQTTKYPTFFGVQCFALGAVLLDRKARICILDKEEGHSVPFFAS